MSRGGPAAGEVGLWGLVPYEQALDLVLDAAGRLAPLADEEVALEEAAGRVLAEAVVAHEAWPPAARAAMDGYAVRCADVAGASSSSPVFLEVVETLVAGTSRGVELGPRQCCRVMTGVVLPAGSDAVVPQEVVREAGDRRIAVERAVEPGSYTFPAGEDTQPGEAVLQPGVRLWAGPVGLLASLGRTRVRVKRRPVMAVLATGDEVVEVREARLEQGQVRNSNAYSVAAQLRAWGAAPLLAGIAPDSEEELAGRVQSAADVADGLVVTGGMSVGLRDLVRPVLERLGVRWHLHRVAIRPGRPVAFGTWNGRPVFGLPGTPGGAFVAAELFVRPLLARWTGQAWRAPEVEGYLAAPVRMAPGRMRWLRARVTTDDRGRLVAEALGRQSSASVRSLADAMALVAIPPEVEELPAGAPVRVRLLEGAAWPS
ncbi:MAG: gephyrin-like molybdotransferase Glp [Bacillota bacterium]